MTTTTSTTDGGPAFPLADSSWEFIDNDPGNGMTLRDYFAGQALTGIISRTTSSLGLKPLAASVEAYHYADAMLKARNDYYSY